MAMSGAEQRKSATDALLHGGVVIDGYRYSRAPVVLHFPAEAEVPESKRHLELRTLLYQYLDLAFSQGAAIGCDQFVYWDPTDPRACLAPDAFVRLDATNDLFPTWKVWERGAPQVAVEIISGSDSAERDWEEKLEKYRRLGVSELVRFDPQSSEPAQVLRIWDRVGDDLLERQPTEPALASRFLPGFWLAVEGERLGPTLRLSHDAQGDRLFATAAEYEAELRHTAEQRVLELEAELRRRPS
jgi:Uma2 family endonuclease